MAIEWALSIPHPLCIEVDLDQGLRTCVSNLAADLPAVDHVVHQRLCDLQFWEARCARTTAVHLDIAGRCSRWAASASSSWCSGADDDHPCQLGTCCHVALYYEMLEACNSVDAFMPDLLLQGFPIVGPIARGVGRPTTKMFQLSLLRKH